MAGMELHADPVSANHYAEEFVRPTIRAPAEPRPIPLRHVCSPIGPPRHFPGAHGSPEREGLGNRVLPTGTLCSSGCRCAPCVAACRLLKPRCSVGVRLVEVRLIFAAA